MGKSCLKDDSVNCKSKSNAHIYVISTEKQANKNIYKIGKHTGSVKKLMSRYKTYYTKPPVLYYFSVTGSDEYIKKVESRILDELQPYLIQGEWVKCLLEDIVTVINKYMYNDKSKVKIEELEDEKEELEELEELEESESEKEEIKVNSDVVNSKLCEKYVNKNVEENYLGKDNTTVVESLRLNNIILVQQTEEQIEQEMQNKQEIQKGVKDMDEEMQIIMNTISTMSKKQKEKVAKIVKRISTTDDGLNSKLKEKKNNIGYIKICKSVNSYIKEVKKLIETDKLSLYYSGIRKYVIIKQEILEPTIVSTTSTVSSYISLRDTTTSKVYEILHENDNVKIYLTMKGNVCNDYKVINRYLAEYLKDNYKVILDVKNKEIDNGPIVYTFYEDDNESQIIIRDYFVQSRNKLMQFAKKFKDFLLRSSIDTRITADISTSDNDSLADRIIIDKYLDDLNNDEGFYKKRVPFDRQSYIPGTSNNYISEYITMNYICTKLRNYGKLSFKYNVIGGNTSNSNGINNINGIDDNPQDPLKAFLIHIITDRPSWYNTKQEIDKNDIRLHFDEFCVNNNISSKKFGSFINKNIRRSNDDIRRGSKRFIMLHDLDTLYKNITKSRGK